MPDVLELVQGIDKKIDENKANAVKILEEQKGYFETKYNEVKTALENADKKSIDEVKQLNEDLAKKGADLEEIRNQVKEMKAKSGRFKGMGGAEEARATELIADAFKEHFDEIKAVRKGAGVKLEIKAVGAMSLATNLTGNGVATYDLTPAVRGRRKINIRDLEPVIQSATGIWKFYRQNTPVGEGSIDYQGGAGVTKKQLDYDLTEETVTVDYLAGFVLIDRGMMKDLPFLQSFIANELVEDFKRAENAKFIPELVAGATGDNSTTSTVLAEKYIDMIANLMGNDYDPTAIITTPQNWATILKTKPNDYSIPGGISIDAQGNIVFIGIPLIPQNNMKDQATKTLIGDFTKAAIIQNEGLSIGFFEQDGDNIKKNQVTARIEAREAQAILRPDAFVTI